MAFTVSTVTDTIFGNMRIKFLNVTADNTSGNVDTGLPGLVFAHYAVKSAATMSGNSAIPRMAVNSGTAGTAIAGTVGFSSTVSGDIYQVVAYGYDL